MMLLLKIPMLLDYRNTKFGRHWHHGDYVRVEPFCSQSKSGLELVGHPQEVGFFDLRLCKGEIFWSCVNWGIRCSQWPQVNITLFNYDVTLWFNNFHDTFYLGMSGIRLRFNK